jgi:hypothetical protein
MLWFGCHAILEHDELKVFKNIGLDVFCLGSYMNPQKPVDPIRPAIDIAPNERWLEMQSRLSRGTKVGDAKHEGWDMRDETPQEFIDEFDVIMIMHIPRWIENNWERFKGKTVIWRTIGQSANDIERLMQKYRRQGLKIVRYSPRESTIPEFAGEDAVIRFPKDPDEFNGWNGEQKSVFTICQSIKERAVACNYEFWDKVTRGFDRKLFGRGNDKLDGSGGEITYDHMKEEMRNNRIGLCVGTKPASYVLNFIEMWLSGMPVLAPGRSWGNAWNLSGAEDLYEIPDFFSDNPMSGFCSDNIEVMRGMIKELLNNDNLAKEMGENGRKAAIRLFSQENIERDWKSFFGSL